MSESKISEISELFTGPVLYSGDYCRICDSEITEQDLEDSVVLQVGRGQFGHLVLSSHHKKCYIPHNVATDVCFSGVDSYPLESLEYMKHFIDLALSRFHRP